MISRSTTETLARVDETLKTAKLGLRDVLGHEPERRLGGLRNVAVFGRAVTNVLQNLRSTEHGFDAWYAPYVSDMANDPLLRYFYKIRTEILKEGVLKSSAGIHIKSFEYPKDMQRLGPPPAGAKGFFIGDRNGGSGWHVELADGQIETFYVDIPGDIAQFEVTLPDAPSQHRGQTLPDRRIGTLASCYIEYLASLVANARQTFGARGA